MRCIDVFWNRKVQARDSAWAWITLASSTFICFSSFGVLYNFGIIYTYLLTEFKDTKEKTAWVSSIPMFLQFILAWLASWIIKRYGLRASAITAAFPLGASLVVTSYATNLDEMFITFSVPFGLACCVMLMAGNVAVSTYFDKRMAVAFGILTGGSGLAQVALTYLVIMLLDNFGLTSTLQILGAILFITCLISSLAYFPTNYETRTMSVTKDKGLDTYYRALKNKKFLFFLVANVIAGFSLSVSSVHQVQFAMELGVPNEVSKQFPVFSTIGNAFGRLSCGFVLDIFVQNKLRYYQLALLAAGLVSCVSSFLTSQTQLIAYIWLYSFLDGQVQASVPIALRFIVGLDVFPEAYSLIISAIAAPVLLGPPLLGFIVDQTEDYRAFFFFAGTPLLLACLSLVAIRCFKNVDSDVNEETKKWINSEKEVDVTNLEKNEQLKNQLLLETPV